MCVIAIQAIHRSVLLLTGATLGDGLRHFAYQKEERFYNGVTLDDIHGEDRTNVNGIHGM